MDVAVTTPEDLDGIRLSVTITARDVMEMGYRAYDEAIRKLADEVAQAIFVKAVTRAL